MNKILILIIFLVACKDREARVYTTYYVNGQVKLKLIYPDKADMKTYQKLTFYDSGKEKCIANYKNGKENGEFINYFPNGTIECKFTMAVGKIEGTKYEYYPNGIQKSLCNHFHGQENGMSKDWYENEKIQSEGKYSNGKRVGLWKLYDENGTYKERNYIDGILEGPTCEILGDTLYAYGQYKNDKEEGK